MKPASPVHFKTIRQLRERSGRESTRTFWTEGERTILTLLKKGLPLEFAVIETGHEGLAALFPSGSAVFACRSSDVNKIKATDTFPGVGAVFRMPEGTPVQTDTWIVLDGIQDPGNLGTLFRTALWFGVPHLLLDRKSADPFHEKVVRASMGAVASIQTQVTDDLPAALKALKQEGHRVIGTDLKGSPLGPFPSGKKVLVFGNEANGISTEVLGLCDQKIRIPGSGDAESLNVTVAAGIVLHALIQGRS